MYNDIQSTILNNCTTCTYFKLQRGVRQGCPLSAYLFIIALETLACKVKNDNIFKGIKIDNKEIKISLLADDITMILADLISLKNSLTFLNIFTKCSGLKINIDKTQSKYISSKLICDYFPHDLSWIKTPIQTLGIVITDNEDKNYKYNFQNKIATLKATLNIWKQRKLSIKGKITIINSLALASLIYVSSVISSSQRVINEINNSAQNFIWNGSTSKIAQKTLILNIENGGLKLFHFETKIKALPVSWIKRMSTEEASAWKILPKHFVNCNNLDKYFSSNHKILSNKEIPLFYKEIHTLFMKYFKQEPTNLLNILNQINIVQ